jgi:predicted outer membrane protein
MTSTLAAAYHKSHVAVAIQQAISYDTDKDLANLATRHSFDQIYGVKLLDSGKRGVKLGSAS